MSQVLQAFFEDLIGGLSSTLDTPDAYFSKIAFSIVAILIGIFINRLIENIFKTYASDDKRNQRMSNLLKIILVGLTVTIVLFIWIEAINTLILIVLLFTFFSIFMMRELAHNIIGFFIIKYRGYFKKGDRVEVDGIIGDVVEINLISFKLLEVRNWLSSDSNTGRFIEIPNSIIFEEAVEVVNEESVLIWQEINYTLSYESDWQAAEQIMTNAVNLYFEQIVLPRLERDKSKLRIDIEGLRPVFQLNTTEVGIVVTMRYLVHYKKGTQTRTDLQKEILPQFDMNPDIQFAPMYLNLVKK